MFYQSSLLKKKNKKTHKKERKSSQSAHKLTINEQQKKLKEKFTEIVQMRRLRFLKEKLCAYYGKNYPLNYKDSFGFQERWQNENSYRKQGRDLFKLKFQHKWQVVVYLVVIVLNILTIWYDSLDYFIDGKPPQNSYKIVYSCSILSQTIDITVKIISQYKTESYKSILGLIYKNVLIIVVHVSKLCLNQSVQRKGYLIIIYIPILLLLYKQTSKLYQSLRFINYSQTHQNHYKVIDLMFTLLIIAHILALVLYLSTKVTQGPNWVSKYGLQTDSQIVFYIYSFYFAATTIFTVGYGDVSPANPFEVVIVILVQICGIIVFAFIINEIGFCLSSLRKKEEMLEKDLTVFEKMKEQYRLNNELSYRVNEYLVNSYKKTHILTPDEEQGVILKLNEELRNQITKTSLFSIVKSSVFFSSRWSGNIQRAVSNKLIHILYSPNDKIYQPQGKQRIYFVKSGRIGIYAELQRHNHKKHFMKTIQNSLDKEVADNCYGYTAALSSRPVRLQAVATEFTSMYFIQKDKFQKSLQSIPDLQYLHQIKSKLELADIIEAFQAPLLASSKNHYHPNKLPIINRNNKLEGVNKRNYVFRNTRKFNCKNTGEADDQIQRMRQEMRRNSTDEINTTLKIQEKRQKLKESSFYKVSSLELSEMTDKQDFQIEFLKQKDKLQFNYLFQSGKDYFNYYTRNNRSIIISRIQLQNYLGLSNRGQGREKSHHSKHLHIQK